MHHNFRAKVAPRIDRARAEIERLIPSVLSGKRSRREAQRLVREWIVRTYGSQFFEYNQAILRVPTRKWLQKQAAKAAAVTR